MAEAAWTWQSNALQRKCKFCERTFAKTEHLSRHQRSHTGEKPYKCRQCSKRFARSDVLTRHQRAHTQPATQRSETQSVSDNGDAGADVPGVQDSTILTLTPPTLDQELNHASQFPGQASPTPTALALERPTPAATQQPDWYHTHLDPMMASPQNHVETTVADVNGEWALDQSAPSQALNGNPTHHASFSHSHFQLDPAPSTTQDLANVQLYPGTGGLPPTDHSSSAELSYNTPSGGAISVEALLNIDDDMNSWFDQYDGGSSARVDDFAILEDRNLTAGEHAIQTAMAQNDTPRSKSMSDTVPIERFASVMQCWRNRSGDGSRIMNTLWQDLFLKAEDNLFCESGIVGMPETLKQRDGSRRGLDQNCRDRLWRVFGRACGCDGETALQDMNEGRIPYRLESGERGANTIRFPPAEILDTGLDLYFRHFHHLLPFIHIPTFNPRSADTSVLFLMCLIGLATVHTRGSMAFIEKAFAITLDLVDSKLSKYTSGAEVLKEELSSTMGSAVLLMTLSMIIGEKADRAIVQRLYLQLLTYAQEQQLFSATENQSQSLHEGTFKHFTNANTKWKAWGRTESMKRLIISILLCDSWISAVQYSCPVIRTGNIKIILPCDAVLFQAETSTKWLELLKRGHQLSMPTLVLSSRSTRMPTLTKPLDVIGMDGMLCAIRLRISEDYHRLLPARGSEVSQHFVPWQIFATDSQARYTTTLVVDVIQVYGEMLSNMNPNCMALWHNMCIMLTADLRIFELGAGSAGAKPAQKALEDIAVWSQTPAARRAIVHAAQTFKLMSDRRPSDGDPFHSSNGLFLAALILGLYVFMVPPQVDDDGDLPVYELLDDVNWDNVGNKGLAYENLYIEDPTVSFIRKGGPISLSGVIHHNGYTSARRILLDFSCLLEDIEKWRIGHYTEVLRIMSDSLLERE